jgi:hypothetical protein
MPRSRGRLVAVLVLAALVCGACAAGLWLGLWHGFIVPVTFVISLFTDDVTIYEVANAGNWYDAGYVLGLVFVLGGGAGSGSAAGRRRR